MSPTFSPISLGGIGRAAVSATSGSPTTNNNARSGKTIYEFNGSGSITVSKAGYIEVALVGGGGGGAPWETSGGGGGGGGTLVMTNHFVPEGNIAITVGAGGSGGSFPSSYGQCCGGSANGGNSFAGYPSKIGNAIAIGGGTASVGSFQFSTTPGVSRGPASSQFISNEFGYSGGNGNTNTVGNAGTTVNLTGSAVVYGGGGSRNGGTSSGGGAGTASESAAANTGGGGAGPIGGYSGQGGSGGSGKVIVVVG